MPDPADYIETLQYAIRSAHGCEAKHVATENIREEFQGKTVWVGVVEIFDLTGHATAQRAYAWGHAARDAGNEVRIVTVLGLPPVDSARKAVQVSILNDIKNRQN